MSTREPSTPAGPEPRNNARRLWLVRDEAGDSEGFDALTDLFLGEVARSRREFGTAPDRHENTSPQDHGQTPRLRLTSEHSDEASILPRSAPSSPREPAKTLEESFLECLVVGNLPAFASAWASQYVREIARAASCPVAYLRIQSGYVSLEIIDETGDHGAGAAVPIQDLDAAMREARLLTHRWIVRVDQADEPAAAARPGVRLVTLLTGVDEAARVHAYGALKDLAERLPRAAQSGPVVRVAVMGASDPQAGAAADKLIDTVRQCLARDVQHAPCSPKIRAGRPARILYNGRFEPPGTQVLDRLASVLGLAQTATATTAIAQSVNSVGGRTDDELNDVGANAVMSSASSEHTSESKPEDAVTARAGIEFASVMDGAVSAGDATREVLEFGSISRTPPTVPAVPSQPTGYPIAEQPPAAVARADDVAIWSAAAEPKAAAETSRGALAAFIAGFTATAVRCPYADEVEIAIDTEGRLHLLARSESPSSDDRVIGGLMVAAAWAESHAPLLRPAIPGMHPGNGTPMLHLFTSTPKASRRLADTSLRLHLLAAVKVGDRSGWYCAELN